LDALDQARPRFGDPAKIADAQKELDLADSLRTSGQFKVAINKFKDALRKAQSA
jgi:hypothetical protein